MLTHPTLDLLHELGLEGCAKGFKDLAANPAAATLDHAEWLGVLLEHEVTRVTFRPLTARDLAHYVGSGEWEGRAGEDAQHRIEVAPDGIDK